MVKMLFCYHKEAFALGLVGALFILTIIHIFEDVIWDTFRRIKGVFSFS